RIPSTRSECRNLSSFAKVCQCMIRGSRKPTVHNLVSGRNFPSRDNVSAIVGMTVFDWLGYDSIP
ncbi:MAG: hypothetical protein WAN41_10960, partial [Candidatus Sulfotelmatobacter sp.]